MQDDHQTVSSALDNRHITMPFLQDKPDKVPLQQTKVLPEHFRCNIFITCLDCKVCVTEVVTHRETVYPNEILEMAQVNQLGKPPLPPFKKEASH